MDAYMQVKEAGIAVAVNLSESWLRNHQVLPQAQPTLELKISVVPETDLAGYPSNKIAGYLANKTGYPAGKQERQGIRYNQIKN